MTGRRNTVLRSIIYGTEKKPDVNNGGDYGVELAGNSVLGNRSPEDRKPATTDVAEADDSNMEIEGMNLSEDEAPPADNEEEDINEVKQLPQADDVSDAKHEKEDLRAIEAARKERADLMAAELEKKEKEMKKAESKEGGEVAAFNKFQYLVGQSEVFAHFLAGPLLQVTPNPKRRDPAARATA